MRKREKIEITSDEIRCWNEKSMKNCPKLVEAVANALGIKEEMINEITIV